MTKRIFAPLFLALPLALSLAACSSPAAESTPTQTAKDSIDGTLSPSPSAPAPSSDQSDQIVSVIAAHESDWRYVIDSDDFCWAFFAEDLTSDFSNAAGDCYSDWKAMQESAQEASNELADLTPPSALRDLHGETWTTLLMGSAYDLQGACGDGELPLENPECNEMIDNVSSFHRYLEGVLDKWEPYL